MRPLLAAAVVVLATLGCSREPRAGRGGAAAPRTRANLRFELVNPGPEPVLALRKAERTIRARLEQGAIRGATVRLEDRIIVVALPLMTEVEIQAVRLLILPEGRLELRLVSETAHPLLGLAELVDGGHAPGIALHRGGNPADLQFDASNPTAFRSWLGSVRSSLRPDDGRAFRFEDTKAGVRAYLIEPELLLSGASIFDAQTVDDNDLPAVRIYLDSAGAEALEELSAQYRGRRLAVLLDERVLVAVRIRDRIRGGQALITLGENARGGNAKADAARLAALLRAGALPGPLRELASGAPTR